MLYGSNSCSGSNGDSTARTALRTLTFFASTTSLVQVETFSTEDGDLGMTVLKIDTPQGQLLDRRASFDSGISHEFPTVEDSTMIGARQDPLHDEDYYADSSSSACRSIDDIAGKEILAEERIDGLHERQNDNWRRTRAISRARIVSAALRIVANELRGLCECDQCCSIPPMEENGSIEASVHDREDDNDSLCLTRRRGLRQATKGERERQKRRVVQPGVCMAAESSMAVCDSDENDEEQDDPRPIDIVVPLGANLKSYLNY